jgi:hypothetical protein
MPLGGLVIGQGVCIVVNDKHTFWIGSLEAVDTVPMLLTLRAWYLSYW